MHDEHVTDEDYIPYFNKKDKDFEALQKIVLCGWNLYSITFVFGGLK